MESNRQKKINQLLQKELAEIFRKQSAEMNSNILISVTEVKVSSDLGVAKVYLSIYPQEYREALMKEIQILNPKIRKILGNRIAKQVRQVPELIFYLDVTLDTVEKIEKALKGKDENPIL